MQYSQNQKDGDQAWHSLQSIQKHNETEEQSIFKKEVR